MKGVSLMNGMGIIGHVGPELVNLPDRPRDCGDAAKPDGREYRTVIVHGPAGSGKTHHAASFCLAFGCKSVVDGFSDVSEIEPGALHLTDSLPCWPGDFPPGALIVPIETALAVAFVLGAL